MRLKGVEGILHTACPCDLTATGGISCKFLRLICESFPDFVTVYIDPAVNGTTSIMQSAMKCVTLSLHHRDLFNMHPLGQISSDWCSLRRALPSLLVLQTGC